MGNSCTLSSLTRTWHTVEPGLKVNGVALGEGPATGPSQSSIGRTYWAMTCPLRITT